MKNEQSERRNERLEILWDREAVRDVVIRYATGIDRRDWEMYRSCFTNEVEIDFTSWTGGSPNTFAVDQWVELVKRTLSGFISTQHTSTNHVITIERDKATCVSYMQAQHYFPNDEIEGTYTIGGYYTNNLERTSAGWKIKKCKLTVTWTTGNRKLFSLAYKRFGQKNTDPNF
jgi:3-phenylpropionate/cinnamic acid dioxygenase small subunit